MAEVISTVLLDETFESEGDVSLGVRLDQVLAVSRFPAVLDLAVYVEVRLDPETDEAGVTVDVSVEGDGFAVPLGSRRVPFVPRGSAWPFVPDAGLVFPVTAEVPAESAAFITVRIDGEIRQVKWIRAVEFPLLDA